MTSKTLSATALAVLLLALAGCNATGAMSPASESCDVTGSDPSLETMPMFTSDSDIDTDEWPIRGFVKAGDDFEAGEGVEGVHVTVSGDGFTTVICTDGDGRWGSMLPAPAPYTVTLNEATIPDGLTLVFPKDAAGHRINVEEATAYPVVESFLFAKSSDNDSADAVSEPADQSAWDVCDKYYNAQLEAFSVASPQELDPSDYTEVGGVTLPSVPGCAFSVVLGNGQTQTALGWDSADYSAIYNAFITAGYTDFVEPYEDAEGVSYTFAPSTGSPTVNLTAGERVYSEIGIEGVWVLVVE
ncbi:hypothetical protein AB1K54_15645 [Microbacterium sp. BWT-B31]|uniref:hypothetical protein n=1 Tax=Microbacterium sp. BWT-B31 TaxID=3232072 RepID=UPI0035283D82